MSDAIDRLEKWKSQHKSHSVEIYIDNGFGCCEWEVTLHGHGGRKICACEFNANPDDFNVSAAGSEDEFEHWPGLAATIHAAIDRWEKLWPEQQNLPINEQAYDKRLEDTHGSN